MGFFMLFVRLGQIAAWLLLINGVLMVTISLFRAMAGAETAVIALSFRPDAMSCQIVAAKPKT